MCVSPLLPNTIPMADINNQSGHTLPLDLNMGSGSLPQSTLGGCHNVISMLNCPLCPFPPSLCEHTICISGRQFYLLMALLLGIRQLFCDFLPRKMPEGCNSTLERLIQSVFTVLTKTQSHRRTGACVVASRLGLELPLRTLQVQSALRSLHQHMYSVILAFPSQFF